MSAALVMGTAGGLSIGIEQQDQLYQQNQIIVKQSEELRELNRWRSNAIKNCIENVVEMETVWLRLELRNSYPNWFDCMNRRILKACSSYDRASNNHYQELEAAFQFGKVPKNPQYVFIGHLQFAAAMGIKARKEAEQLCSKDPSVYIYDDVLHLTPQ